MYGVKLTDDGPLVRTYSPDGADWIEVCTSYAEHVPEEEEEKLAHGWGVAPHDHDVQSYTRVDV